MNIIIQFPNHHHIGQITLNSESFENGLITTFPSINEWDDNKTQSLFGIFVDFFKFGADYFEKGKVNGEDVAAKIKHQLGEIWLDDRWHFSGVWPHSVNFGEMCYSSDPTVDLEVTWRFQKFELLNP